MVETVVDGVGAIIDERRNTQARAAAIAQQNVLAFPGGDRSSPAEQGDVITLLEESERGASAAYLLSRVHRGDGSVLRCVGSFGGH